MEGNKLFTKSQLEVLREYFPIQPNRCERCLFRLIDDDNCWYCSEIDEYHDAQDCQEFHLGFECSKCFFDSKHNKTKIIYKMLKTILRGENYEMPFMSVYNTFLLDGSISQQELNKLLFLSLKRSDISRADFILKLGANINQQFNPNITLPAYLSFRPDLLEYINDCGYNFSIQNDFKNNGLGTAIRRFISERMYSNYLEHIQTMLEYLSWDDFDIRIITGLEYGDRTHDIRHYNNHYWRRRRIDVLLGLGMPYDLDAIVLPKRQKKLRNTRLGYYLVWREVFKPHN
jgi:hypothetical protein